MPRPRSLRSLTISQNASAGPMSSTGPPSPTLSETTNASQMNFGVEGPDKIITRGDLKSSLQAYENLLSCSANYRDALLHMSRATASYADALGTCASLKGTSYLSGSRLQAASGLHHLMGNHWHVLSDSIDKQFEKPLRQHLETYRATVAERSATYERALREKSRIIRLTEQENMNLGRKKNRNLQSFREALAVLQRQVEELDELRVSHYQEILEHEEEVWDFVQGKVSLVVRSTLDVIDRFTAKASDPVLEPMIQSIPDPFDLYGPPKPEDQIFSILPPLSIFNAPSPSPSPQSATAEIDATPAFGTTSASLSWTGNQDHVDYQPSEWADVRTPTSSPPPSIRSTSTLTRSASPPGGSRGTLVHHSVSASSSSARNGSQPRKSEAKLRQVLSVINEGQSQAGSSFNAKSHEREGSASTLRPSNEGSNGQHEEDLTDHQPDWGSPDTNSTTGRPEGGYPRPFRDPSEGSFH